MRICEKIRTSAVFIAEVRSFNNSYRLQEAYVQGPQSQKSPRMHDVVPIVVTIAVRMVMTISRTRFQGNFFIIHNRLVAPPNLPEGRRGFAGRWLMLALVSSFPSPKGELEGGFKAPVPPPPLHRRRR